MTSTNSLLNVEIKARCDDPHKIRTILRQHEADFVGTDHQTDSYFHIQEGRLKLREGTIENNLIYYRRADTREPKASDIELVPVPGEQRSGLKNLLRLALGIRVTVEKEREIYFIENVKFHIDKVTSLGSFIEIEAIDKDGSRNEQHLQRQCSHYMKLLQINDSDLIEVSYSDLLAEKA